MTVIVRNGQPPVILSTIQIGAAGPAGPGTVVAYVHTQSGASTLWTITHNLGFYPQVATFDATSQIEGDIVQTSINSLTVTFSAAVSGKAYLS